MIMPNLDIRPYKPGDESHILRLFQQSFGRNLGKKLWIWRFMDNPAGLGVIELCWDGDILVAQYAVTAVASRIDGQDCLTGLSGTTMTHSKYRGMGLFPILARKTYARMAEMGMVMAWGFPNAMSHRGFVKDLDWTNIYEIPVFHLNLMNSQYLSLPTSDDALAEVTDFDERFDLLWETVKDDHSLLTKRDQRYLQWRYVQNPSGQYRILTYLVQRTLLGYAVFKQYRDEIQIVDILTVKDVKVGVRLISGIVEIARRESAVAVSLWLNVSHLLHHTLERIGFRNSEPITYFGGLVLRPNLSETELYDFRRWYLTMGDSDVF